MSKTIPGSKNKHKREQTAKKRKTEQINDQQNQEKMIRLKTTAEYILLAMMFVVIALLLFFGPFQRGLFFPNDLLRAKIVIFGLLILWGLFRLLKREGLRLNSPLNLCLLVLLIAYFISFFVAVHKRDALEQLLKIASYLVVYLAVYELSVSKIWPFYREKTEPVGEDSNSIPPGLNLILHLALAAAVVVTIASIGAAAGHWFILGAYQDAGLRIASPLGYSNTAAAYLMAAYFLNIGLATMAGSWWKRCIYLMPAALILTTTILTFSRGAWLLLPPLIILMILVSAPGMRLRSALLIAATLIPAIPAAFLADPLFRSPNPPGGWGPLVLTMIVAFLLGALSEYYLVQKYRTRQVLGIAVLAAVLISLIFLFVFPFLSISGHDALEPEGQESLSAEQRLALSLSTVLPERYHDRIFSAGRDRNLQARLEMFRDASKIIRDYPLLGTGGGGFKALYQSYQERIYFSTEVHNHFLQVWVEAGIFGFLAFVGIWISFTAAFIRNCMRGRASSRVWQFWTTTFVPVAALGAHSVIDWNFSLAAVGIYLFVLLGAGRSMDRVKWFDCSNMEEKKPGYSSLFTGIVAVIAGIFLLVYTITLLNGLNATWRSQDLLEKNNLKQAIVEMEKAIRLDPLLAENYHNLSVLTEEQLSRMGNQESLVQVIDLARKAQELEPYNALYSSRYGVLMLNYVNIEEGLYYIDRVITLNRLYSSSYFQSAISRLQLAEYYLEAGNRREAEQYLEEILAYEPLMEENSADSRALSFIFGRASQLLRDYAAAVKYYEAVPEGDQSYDLSRQFLAEILGDD